jgi:hypothetical protein
MDDIWRIKMTICKECKEEIKGTKCYYNKKVCCDSCFKKLKNGTLITTYEDYKKWIKK